MFYPLLIAIFIFDVLAHVIIFKLGLKIPASLWSHLTPSSHQHHQINCWTITCCYCTISQSCCFVSVMQKPDSKWNVADVHIQPCCWSCIVFFVSCWWLEDCQAC